MSKLKYHNLQAAVDDLGLVKAAIADLSVKETELKNVLIDSAETRILGKMYQATVSDQVRTTLDVNKARQFLTEEQIKQCTVVTPCIVVRVSARTKI